MTPLDRRWISFALCALLGLAAPAAFTKPERGPTFAFDVPRAELIATIRTIGVMPLVVPAVVPNADAVAARYESEIVARLTSAGFSVIPPSAMREIRERTLATLGGLYDPMTGNPIKEKAYAFDEFSANEYRAAHKVDAVLEPAIMLRDAQIVVDSLRWDGIEDSLTGESGWINFWKEASYGYGQMPALSFTARLIDVSGKSLYIGVGGLQVIGYWKNTGGMWVVKDRLLRIDPKFIMTDPARDARALSLALDPLLHGKISPSAKVTMLPAPTPETSSASKLSREELLARFPRLVLASLDLEEIKQRDEVRRRYRDALTEKLTHLGFEVVGGDDYDGLWNAERAAVGGFFDPFTGSVDESKLKASRLRVFRSMQEHRAVTAIVLPRVVMRMAPFNSGDAEWDGIKESLTGKSRLRSVLSLDPILRYGGTIRALSLELQMIDPGGETIFDAYGGIQITEHFNPTEHERLPDSQLFSDPAKDTRAVDIALASLVASVPATPR